MLWEECAAVGMPRAVVVTRLDHPRADFDELVSICQRVFGDGVMPLMLPMMADDGSPAGFIDLITERIHDYSDGTRVDREPEATHLELIEGTRSALIEGIIAESEDEKEVKQPGGRKGSAEAELSDQRRTGRRGA